MPRNSTQLPSTPVGLNAKTDNTAPTMLPLPSARRPTFGASPHRGACVPCGLTEALTERPPACLVPKPSRPLRPTVPALPPRGPRLAVRAAMLRCHVPRVVALPRVVRTAAVARGMLFVACSSCRVAGALVRRGCVVCCVLHGRRRSITSRLRCSMKSLLKCDVLPQ